MLKYDFLSVHCFPEKCFIDPRDHIDICADFGNVERFNLKKKGLRTYRHTHIVYMEIISVIQQLGN